MNWTRTLACVIVGFLVAAHTARAQDVKSDQEILIDLEREWDEAFHSQNAEFIDGVLADEFIATYGDGSRVTRRRNWRWRASSISRLIRLTSTTSWSRSTATLRLSGSPSTWSDR